MPAITALMTTYNSAAHVCETVNSILAQSFADFVFLIVDDGSTDGTVALLKQYTDKRLCLIENSENKGVGQRLSEALLLVNTPYLAKVDSDDISHPQRFEKQLNFLKAHPQLDIIKSYFSYFADNDDVAQSERFHQFKTVKEKEHNAIDSVEAIRRCLPRWNCVMHTTYFAKSFVIKRLGYTHDRIGEDYSLFYRALENGYLIGCIPEYLTEMRVSHFSATTQVGAATHFVETLVHLKTTRLKALALAHDGLWIYGTGALGQATCHLLKASGYSVKGFLDKEAKADIVIQGQQCPVLTLSPDIHRGIVIAAQPVRTILCNTLLDAGLVEWEDFMVIA
ncbi:glycosyltransferase family 2 protein [Arsukibacterium sp.]|uniref:glycosyltransferase family 2 protein n=1 Tax=Arsukibacterium sp. TaxID=1977258 RepID=UPI002FDB5C57